MTEPASNNVLGYTPYAQAVEHVHVLYENFAKGLTIPCAYRRTQLSGLLRFLTENDKEIKAAMCKDLKCESEARIEHSYLVSETVRAIESLDSWMDETLVPTILAYKLDTCSVKWQPLGVALVIGAWNYPFILILEPLISAIAAGCAALIKPSEVAENSAALITAKLLDYVDARSIAIFNGGAEETKWLLSDSSGIKFDKIFYTGNATVGKMVYEAATRHLTPVTLELGGKSPAIVMLDQQHDGSSIIETAARRIVWGKFLNAGQTCVAPDYILCHEAAYEELLIAMCRAVKEFYGEDPQSSSDYSRIINKRHMMRLSSLLDSVNKEGLDAIIGGKIDLSDRYMAPTILKDVPYDSILMEDEIFGPIMPVIKISSLEEAVNYVNAHSHPLALYLFSSKKDDVENVLERTKSGTVCINDSIMQLVVSGLPFGGIGASGFGCYHGKHGFEAFSHKRAVMWRSLGRVEELTNKMLRYPPMDDSKLGWQEWFVGRKPKPIHYK